MYIYNLTGVSFFIWCLNKSTHMLWFQQKFRQHFITENVPVFLCKYYFRALCSAVCTSILLNNFPQKYMIFSIFSYFWMWFFIIKPGFWWKMLKIPIHFGNFPPQPRLAKLSCGRCSALSPALISSPSSCDKLVNTVLINTGQVNDKEWDEL